MIKWEYLVKELIGNLYQQQTALTALGLEGWEFAWQYREGLHTFFYLKRPIKQEGVVIQ